MSEPAIKSMNLYSEVNRVYNDLRSVGINDGDAIPVEVLSQFDQYHYHGTKAVDQESQRRVSTPPQLSSMSAQALVGQLAI